MLDENFGMLFVLLLLLFVSRFSFSKLMFAKISFQNPIRMTNNLDPDEGPNCLHNYQQTALESKALLGFNYTMIIAAKSKWFV